MRDSLPSTSETAPAVRRGGSTATLTDLAILCRAARRGLARCRPAAFALLRAMRLAGGTWRRPTEPRRDPRVVFRCSARSAQSKARPERARACARCSGWLTQNATERRATASLNSRPCAADEFPLPHAMPPAQVRSRRDRCAGDLSAKRRRHRAGEPGVQTRQGRRAEREALGGDRVRRA